MKQASDSWLFSQPVWYTWKTACSLAREIRRTRSEGSVAQFCIVELHSHAQIVKAAIKSEASDSAYNSSDQSLIEWQFAMYDVFISFFFFQSCGIIDY